MDVARKIGIGVVMVVPAFVIGGMIWELLGSWLAVFGLEIIMALLYSTIITGKPFGALYRA